MVCHISNIQFQNGYVIRVYQEKFVLACKEKLTQPVGLHEMLETGLVCRHLINPNQIFSLLHVDEKILGAEVTELL